MSFARQLHEHFFPGEATERLSRAIGRLLVAVRRDTVEALRRTLAFVTSADLHDAAEVRRFATREALAINGRDLAWRAEADELWERLNLRGATLMARRGALRAPVVRAGWCVAAGS